MKSFRALILALACSLAASHVAAQEDAADSRATSFQAVEGPQKENVPGGPLLVGAYGFVLLMLLGYVARLGLLQRKTSAEVERLARAIEQKRKA